MHCESSLYTLTEKDKQEMLQQLVQNLWRLFGDVPSDILLNRDLNIAESEAETTLLRLNRIASKNITKETHTSFLLVFMIITRHQLWML